MKSPVKTSFILAAGLLLYGTGLTQAQSVWSPMPGAPNWSAALYNDVTLQSPAPGTLWGMEYYDRGLGVHGFNIFSTTDNGQSWHYPSGISNPVRLVAFGAQSAWIQSTTVLYRTTSGAANFQVINASLPAQFSLLTFFDDNTGVATVAGSLYRTTDGGASWNPIPGAPSSISPKSTSIDNTKGSYYQTALSNGQVLSTQDAGLTWHSSSVSFADVRGFAFTDELHGLAYGYDYTSTHAVIDRLARTSDGGVSWTPVVPVGHPRCAAVAALRDAPDTYVGGRDSTAAYPASGEAKMVISRDGGTTWTTVSRDPALANRPGFYYSQLVSLAPGQLVMATGLPQRNIYPILMRYGGAALAARNSQPAAEAFTAYPNPSRGLVELAGPLGAGSQVRVYDATGRLRQQQVLSAQQRQLDLAALPAGLYQLVVTTAQGQVSRQPISKE